jgi:hypothetical protein
MYSYVCMYVCMYVCVEVCVYMYLYICVYMYVYKHMCVCVCVFICRGSRNTRVCRGVLLYVTTTFSPTLSFRAFFLNIS